MNSTDSPAVERIVQNFRADIGSFRSPDGEARNSEFLNRRES